VFNVPFQHKYGYPYKVNEGQRYININPGRLFQRITFYCIWRLSALTTGLHGQVITASQNLTKNSPTIFLTTSS